MNFLEALSNELLENYNDSVTENGAHGYRTTGKELLDLNFSVASLRSASDDEVVKRFQRAFYEDKPLAIKWLFFARDVRGGLGERRLFRLAIKSIADTDPVMVSELIPLIPEYGRFDDLLCLLDTSLENDVLSFMAKQLLEDKRNADAGKPFSLLAKWMPSANASAKKTREYARRICRAMRITEREYRKLLSRLRQKLDIVERKMSDKEWQAIRYEAVPSRANLVYNNAFLRNDEYRRREYLSKLERGETKINSSVLYPHDIVHKYVQSSTWSCRIKKTDAALEAMWKGLPDLVNGDHRTIVVADGSGSMLTRVGGTSISALEVADALAIYFAERSSGAFKDKYITFSGNPQLVNLKATSLRDKIQIAFSHNECANTNIQKVFELILSTAINNRMSQDDMPANILIISDMEFDAASSGGWDRSWRRPDKKLFSTIKESFENAGYKMPRLVFWNVNSRTGTIPVKENDLGVALVSGFSVNICKMVMSGKLDPFECLLETINSERYKPVEEAINRAANYLPY